MADTATPSQPAPSQQANTSNTTGTRSRRRRHPRRPREDQTASAESPGTAQSSGEASTQAGSKQPQPNTSTPTHSGHQRQNGAPSSSVRGRRGGRHGRGSGGSNRLEGGPAAATTESTELTAPRGPTARQRARRGGSFIPGARPFGGHLTKPEPQNGQDEDNTTGIHGDANAISGQTVTLPGTSQPNVVIEAGPSGPPRRSNHHGKPPRRPKTVREAEDLMTRIHNDISSGDYECMICYSAVTRKSKVWACTRCHAAFHLGCVKKWAKQALDAPEASNNDDIVPLQRTWRCPGCQNPSPDTPERYTCWCGKSENPETARFVPPHSCGQTCGKQREVPKDCPHGCELQCHAGPCPPCSAMGPQVPCFCGKEVSQKRCVDTDYEGGWSCAQICGDMMPCGEHFCNRPCHEGMCGACEVTETLRCYCGEEERAVKCCDKLPPKTSHGVDDSTWEGFWQCNKTCERDFDCGKHKCQKRCHAQDAQMPHCPFSPDVVKFCPCGKTPLDANVPRQSCTDPIPHCDKVCLKKLPCGHKCEKRCHTGDCGYCTKMVDVLCRCGRTSTPSRCLQGREQEPPWCRRTCHATLNCLRHECGERCCAGEQKARERMQSKKKVQVRGRTEDIEPEHICTRVCGKTLKCGLHTCAALCHRGACGSCLEANFDELACHCGRTRIMPPILCGTGPPACRFPCQRPKSCGHPNPADHLCHPDDEPCPNCPYLVQKKCLCGRAVIKNQPCWRESVSCGQTCGKLLSCGSHVCQKTCHAAGDCEEPCKQTCGKSRAICGHDCRDPCHAPFACSVDTPCTTRITVSCPCGHVKQEVACATSSRNQAPKRPEIKCIDDCRRRQLAAAFNVDLEKKTAEESANAYSEDTLEFYIDSKAWCTGIEKMLRDFCADNDKVRLAFKPMKSHLRQFIHNLAEDYGLDSESEDPEPYRSVVVTKNNRWSMPARNLAEALKLRRKGDTGLAGVGVPVSAVQQLRKATGSQPVNAILLSGLRVGLLTSELEADLQPLLRGSSLRFGIRWCGDEEALLEPQGSALSTEEVEVELHNVKPVVRRHVTTYRIASAVELCWVGRDGKVASREGQQTGGGWNIVSGKQSARLTTQTTSQTRSSSANVFGVLGGGAGSFAAAAGSATRGTSTVAKAQSKVTSPVVPKDEPVDDWLEAVENEEREAEAEKAAASAAASSVEDNGQSADEQEGSAAKEVEGKEDPPLTT
ncbi:FKBP12-associated protein [Orbilia brochopaga]|uniref:FKBP12-associated protein n=1 Tax=Orbilia brochopaga TaxID=3140254 RepID=A0AAV9UL83_9PEZI